jgi:hypothetical protein
MNKKAFNRDIADAEEAQKTLEPASGFFQRIEPPFRGPVKP